MTKFLEINLSEFIKDDDLADYASVEGFCVCCLSQNTLFVSWRTCKHKLFLDVFFKNKFQVENPLICSSCHHTLKEIEKFRELVDRSLSILTDKISNSSYSQNSSKNLNGYYKSRLSKSNCEILANIKVEDIHEFTERTEKYTYETTQASTAKEESNVLQISTAEEYNIDMDSTMKPCFDDYDLVTEIKVEEDGEDEIRIDEMMPRKGVKKMTTVKGRKSRQPKEKYEGKIRTVILSNEELMMERESLKCEDKYQKLPFKCKLCIIGFGTETIYKSHVKKHHDKKKQGFSCDVCKSVLQSIPILNEHKRRHLRRFECEICLKRYHDSYSAVQHYNDCHGDVDTIAVDYKCDECNFKTNSYRSYRYHRSKHNKPSCPVCGNIFVTNSSLKMHMLTKHKPTPVTYKCEPCNKEYKSKSGLHSHNASAHGGGAQCPSCRTHYRSHRALLHHLKTHSAHRDGSENKFECDYCGEKFINKHYLRGHIEWEHLLIRNHRCIKCDKVFKTSSALKKHDSYVHEKIRPPRDKICDYCGEAFTTNSILKAHLRAHTGQRPLKCTFCPADFSHSAALYNHTRLLHGGQKKK